MWLVAAIKLFRSTEMKNTLESDVGARRARTVLASGNTVRGPVLHFKC